MTFRWPFKAKKNKHWVGINLSTLTPSAVIYSDQGIVESVSFHHDDGIAALEHWLKKRISQTMPAVLVLDDADYELLLVEAPEVPDEELTAAIEFRIGDLLNQPVAETAVQAVRLPRDAYRGRMSMAHVIASPNSVIQKWVKWAAINNLSVNVITVPEFSLLNILSINDIDQGIAILELGPNYGAIRLYQQGALYLTRQVEVGLNALAMQNNDSAVDVQPDATDELDIEENNESFLLDEVDLSNAAAGELDVSVEELETDLKAELEAEINDAYVGFAPKAKIDAMQVDNLILEVQRSLDYYESQLGMGQITQLWVMAGDEDLTLLVDAMQPALAANIKQPDISKKLQQIEGVGLSVHEGDINNRIIALGGALAYAAR